MTCGTNPVNLLHHSSSRLPHSSRRFSKSLVPFYHAIKVLLFHKFNIHGFFILFSPTSSIFMGFFCSFGKDFFYLYDKFLIFCLRFILIRKFLFESNKLTRNLGLFIRFLPIHHRVREDIVSCIGLDAANVEADTARPICTGIRRFFEPW